jgi:hypothetical protein
MTNYLISRLFTKHTIMLNINKLYSDTAYKRPTGGFLPEVPHEERKLSSQYQQFWNYQSASKMRTRRKKGLWNRK